MVGAAFALLCFAMFCDAALLCVACACRLLKLESCFAALFCVASSFLTSLKLALRAVYSLFIYIYLVYIYPFPRFLCRYAGSAIRCFRWAPGWTRRSRARSCGRNLTSSRNSTRTAPRWCVAIAPSLLGGFVVPCYINSVGHNGDAVLSVCMSACLPACLVVCLRVLSCLVLSCRVLSCRVGLCLCLPVCLSV